MIREQGDYPDQETHMDERIFSQRGYENRPCYNYYQFSREFRAELAKLITSAASPPIMQALLHFVEYSNGSKYARIEVGAPASVLQFINAAPSVYILDLVEQFVRLYQGSWPDAEAVDRTKALVDCLNQLFDRFTIGYIITGKILMRRDSRYFDAKVVRKVYRLLFAAGFEPALASFEGALEAMNAASPEYTKALFHLDAALSQTLRELLKRYENSDQWDGMTLEALIDKAATLTDFTKEAVEAGRATVFFLRNTQKMVHGMGTPERIKPGDFPPAHAGVTFALNVAGAYIILLLQLNKDLIASRELSEWDIFA
jgi:hypothetical protein